MIFTFASFKGGVGRTHTLVHTGVRLAYEVRALGLRVLLVDMDLDAPGFSPYFSELDLDTFGGFEALFNYYQETDPEKRSEHLSAAIAPPEEGDERPWLVTIEEAPNLCLLPAGSALSAGYARLLKSLTDSSLGSGDFFDDFREALNSQWDYVLIDSRAGLAELTFATAIRLADVLVPCARLNQANIDGIRDIYGTFITRCAEVAPWERRGYVVPVLTPVPPRAGIDVMNWVETATQTFFPEWRKEDKFETVTQGELQLTDVQKMFPLVHRVFEDQTARVGEERFLKLDGTPNKGVDEEVPFFKSFSAILARFRALNADRDVGGAKLVESYLYNVEVDRAGALKYWEKRLNLRPLDEETWDGLRLYLDKSDLALRGKARQIVESHIEELRQQTTSNFLELAIALCTFAQYYDDELEFRGVELAREALQLCGGHQDLTGVVEVILGNIIVKALKSGYGISDNSLGETVSWQAAETHLRNGLASGSSTVDNGETYFLLAEVLDERGGSAEVVRLLDSLLLECSESEFALRPFVARVLSKQANYLAICGYKLEAIENLMRAIVLHENSYSLGGLQSVALDCGFFELSADAFLRQQSLFRGFVNPYAYEAERLHYAGAKGDARDVLERGREIAGGALGLKRVQIGFDIIDGVYTEEVELTEAVREFGKLSSHGYGFPSVARLLVALASGEYDVSSPGSASVRSIPTNYFAIILCLCMCRALKGDSIAQDLMQDLEELLSGTPLLAVTYRYSLPGRLSEAIWMRRKWRKEGELITLVDDFLKKVHAVPAPSIEDLKPRDETVPLPSLPGIPDTWEP